VSTISCSTDGKIAAAPPLDPMDRYLRNIVRENTKR